MPEIQKIIDGLGSDTLLGALDPEPLRKLLDDAARRELAKGETIINQGDETGDFAICLLEGALKIAMVSVNGREIILNYASPGDVVGEIAMLDSGPRTASVSAIEPSEVLVIPSRAFESAAVANPRSMVGVMKAMGSRIRQLNLVVESDRTFSMAPRLARALVRLLDPDTDGGQLRHNPNQADLGAFAGLARENVSRLLSEWEDQGIIVKSGRSLEIRDRDYIEFLAEFGGDD